MVGSSILPSGTFFERWWFSLREMRAAPKAFGVGREFDSPLWHFFERWWFSLREMRAAPKAFGVGREFDSPSGPSSSVGSVFAKCEQPRKLSGLVGSSILPSGTFIMPWVYILRGKTGRHYIGSTVDLDARFEQHLRGHTATTQRLGGGLKIVAKKEVSTLGQARELERLLKSKKNPALAIFHLSQH